LSKIALLIMLAVVAVSLCWLGISTIKSHRSASKQAPSSQSLVALAKPASATTSTEATDRAATSVEPEVKQQADVPTSTVNEEIPNVPQSALETIRGTVRVSVRVIVDSKGAVVAAIADDRGPSRYFERLSVEASKNWTFTPVSSDEQRIMLVRFNFTRAGATAHASPVATAAG
jgi:hypothetical protein